MGVNVLTAEDVTRLVSAAGPDVVMDSVIAELTRALAAFDPAVTIVPKRSGFTYYNPQLGCIEWMPVLESGRCVVLKTVGYHPDNPTSARRPTIQANIAFYDVRTGSLEVLMDGVIATAIRTGAASAVATHVLAHPASRVLGIVGCGMQGVTQAHAISRVRPIAEIVAFDVDPDRLDSFAERLAFTSIPVRRATVAEIARSADVICTATTVAPGAGPVIPARGYKPHVHINAVGSDLPGKIEVPKAVLEQALVCPDFREQAVEEGECSQLRPEQVGPSLAEIVADPERWSEARQRTTVFDSTGFALEDNVILKVLTGLARAYQIGRTIALEYAGPDTSTPYAVEREVLAGAS